MYSELINVLRGFDRESTENYYRDQLTAKENCSCVGCIYFEDVFLKNKLQLYTVLEGFGIDVRKEQDVDPEGLWMILDDDNKLCRCTIDYVVFGDFDEGTALDKVFEFFEDSLRINLEFNSLDKNAVMIRLKYQPIA